MPLTADDKWSICTLLARYARCLDAADPDLYADNFTPDAYIDNRGDGPFVGRDQIKQFVADLRDRGQVGGSGVNFHVMGLPVIEDGPEGSALVSSYFVLVTPTAGGKTEVAMGSYADVCVKHNGAWLFKRRVIKGLAGTFPTPDK